MRNNKHQSPLLVKDEVPTTSSLEKGNIFNGYFARTYTLKEADSTLPKVQTPEPNIEVIMFTATGLFYVN